MARPKKEGCDEFSLSVTFFTDREQKTLKARYGAEGLAVYLYLLCEIYRNGYYLQEEPDLVYIIADDLHISPKKTDKIITFLCSRGYLDQELRETEKVLSSRNIQAAYQNKIRGKALKNPVTIEKYWLLSKEETEGYIVLKQNNEDSSRNNGGISEKNPDTPEDNKISKLQAAGRMEKQHIRSAEKDPKKDYSWNNPDYSGKNMSYSGKNAGNQDKEAEEYAARKKEGYSEKNSDYSSNNPDYSRNNRGYSDENDSSSLKYEYSSVNSSYKKNIKEDEEEDISSSSSEISIKDAIEYQKLVGESPPELIPILDEIVKLLSEFAGKPKGKIRIGQQEIAGQELQKQLARLKYPEVHDILKNIKSGSSIRNLRNYLLTALYQAALSRQLNQVRSQHGQAGQNSFNNFQQRSYNYSELEQRLLEKDSGIREGKE